MGTEINNETNNYNPEVPEGGFYLDSLKSGECGDIGGGEVCKLKEVCLEKYEEIISLSISQRLELANECGYDIPLGDIEPTDTDFEEQFQNELYKKEEKFRSNLEMMEKLESEASKNGIATELIMSLIGQESAFGTLLKSKSGYIGYMQLREDTSIAELLRLKLITKEQAKKALKNNGKTIENIICGIRYLKIMLDAFEGYKDQEKLALAAYNGGINYIKRKIKALGYKKPEPSFDDFKKHLRKETREYPGKVLKIAKTFYFYSNYEKNA